MSLEVTLLRAFKTRANLFKYIKLTPLHQLDERARVIIKMLTKYYAENPEVQQLDMATFRTWFYICQTGLDKESLAIYELLFDNMSKESDPVAEGSLVQRLAEMRLADRCLTSIDTFNQNGDIKLVDAILTHQQECAQAIRNNRKSHIGESIADLFNEDTLARGFSFRHPELKRQMKPFVAGTTIIVAGRPDTGKTWFGGETAVEFATQLPVLFPNEKRKILWLNNEGQGAIIKRRLIHSAIGKPMDDILEMHKAGTLQQEYMAALGTDNPEVIEVHDIHGWTHAQVQELIERENPAAVFYDMVDNINFTGNVANKGDRTDRLLEALYAWARALAAMCGHVAVFLSQTSSDAEGLIYPPMHMLKDSKTGKQGASDVILVIGRTHDPATPENIRYLSTPKNKLIKPGLSTCIKLETRMDTTIGRYV